MHEQNWVYLPCACQCGLPVYPRPGWSIRARQVDRSSRSSAFSQQGYVSPWRQRLHTHTHARGMPCINHFKYICTNFFGFLTLQLSKYHRFCTVVLNLHSCGRQFKVQCAIETPLWVTPAGTRRSLSGEDLKLTHMEIVSEGEAWGESEKRTTELKGKQKKLPERSHKTDWWLPWRTVSQVYGCVCVPMLQSMQF